MESKSNNTQACRETGKVEAPIDGKLSMVVIVQSHRASAGMRASCFSSAFRCWCFVTEGRVVDDDDDDDEIGMAKDPGWGQNMPALVGQWKLPVKQKVLVKAQFINFVFSTHPPWLQIPFNEYVFTHSGL